jgi:SET family sugar efflux transporter-like MFS transporter
MSARATKGMPRNDVATVNAGVRAMISLSWVLVPGITGALLSRSSTMLPAYLFAGLACIVCLALIAVFLPRQRGTDKAATHHLSYLAALGEVVSPQVFFRVIAVALISSTLHVNGAILPLIVTGAAHGTVADIGIIVGIVALLEVVFIVVWGRMRSGSMSHVTALAIGTVLYVVYLLFSALPRRPGMSMH